MGNDWRSLNGLFKFTVVISGVYIQQRRVSGGSANVNEGLIRASGLVL